GVVRVVGGGGRRGPAGARMVRSWAATSGVKKPLGEVATTRPEPLRSWGRPFPAVLRAIVASSWSCAVPAVPIVTVFPGATARIAPLPSAQHPGQVAPGQPLTGSRVLSTVQARPARVPPVGGGAG